MILHRSFQIGDHFIARTADHTGVIPGTIVDIDREYYHVDWGEWGKKLVPISWVETLRRWMLTYRPGPDTIHEPVEIKRNQHGHN